MKSLISSIENVSKNMDEPARLCHYGGVDSLIYTSVAIGTEGKSMIRFTPKILGSLLALGFANNVNADVVSKSPDHYTLRHEVQSSLSPEFIWEKLINPASWWHPDHTYSGDAANLSLDSRAGGLWREDWDDGSVLHGSVLLIRPGKQLKLDAPFGPLQDIAVKVVWTITLEPSDKGTKIIFDEIANGTTASKLDELAPAVDFVKTEAINRLAAE